MKESCSRLTRSLEKIVWAKCELSAMMEKARLARDFILTINGVRVIEPTARCDIAGVGKNTIALTFDVYSNSLREYSALSTNICASVSTGFSCGLPAPT
jgi:hypothetical protein